MKKLLLISALLFSFNGWADEVKVVCEMEGSTHHGKSWLDGHEKSEEQRLFLYWTFDDITNKFIGLTMNGDGIDGSILRHYGDNEHTKIESNEDEIRVDVSYFSEDHPVITNVHIASHNETVKLNRYVGKSYMNGNSKTVITFKAWEEQPTDLKMQYEHEWDLEGECILAKQKF